MIVEGATETVFPYIPVHMEYIMFELLKNSLRATVEFTESELPLTFFFFFFSGLCNLMSVVVEGEPLPPVYVTIGRGTKDVTIRLRDRGGGVPYEALGSIWDYSYTTVGHGRKRRHPHKESPSAGNTDEVSAISSAGDSGGSGATAAEDEDQSIFATQVSLDVQTMSGGPMAGLGYGLPMSKVYANFFGGDLQLVSLYGHGCDVFLRLNRLEDQTSGKI